MNTRHSHVNDGLSGQKQSANETLKAQTHTALCRRWQTTQRGSDSGARKPHVATESEILQWRMCACAAWFVDQRVIASDAKPNDVVSMCFCVVMDPVLLYRIQLGTHTHTSRAILQRLCSRSTTIDMMSGIHSLFYNYT